MGSSRLPAGGASSPLLPCNAATLSLLLLLAILHAGQADGYSLAAAKDASRISTTVPPLIRVEEPHRDQVEFERGHGIQHHGHGPDTQHPIKHHHQQPQEAESPKAHPDFEKQLSQLKEDPGSVVESKPQQSIVEDDAPINPVSRKDELFTPGLGVEEVSLFPPPRRTSTNKDEDDAEEGDLPVQTDLLASEADVLEELKKLSAIHDAMDPSLHPTRPPLDDSSGSESDGSVEDSSSEEDDDSDEDEEEEEEATEEPDVASLEERLSHSLRTLSEQRKQEAVQSNEGSLFNQATGPGTASGASGVPTADLPRNIDTKRTSSPTANHEGDDASRAVMKKAHMARKLMDPDDPKKDEDLLELMLRIAENPDEWKRVHHLLRQLDDDLTTYEKTMHRMEALAMEKSSDIGEAKKGKKKPGEEDEKEQRRIEMSKSGLPSGTHGENLSSTTQQPIQTTVTSTHHKDWPRFAYHRVTTAPHPYFLQQQNHQNGTPHHRNAYIAVSVITPPKGRHVGKPSPSPTPEPPRRLPPREGEEENFGEEMEEEIVENVAKTASRHHKPHGDPIEEQLRTLAGVEAKIEQQLREKERIRHALQEAGMNKQYEDYSRSKRSVKKSSSKRQNRPNGLILLKTS